MIDVAQAVADLEAHFRHAEQTAQAFLGEHIPGLLKLGQEITANPLLKAAYELEVPDSTKTMLAGLLKGVEAEVRQVQAAAEAQAAAVPRPDPAAPPA